MRITFLWLCLCFLAMPSFAKHVQPLPAEQAFSLSVQVNKANEIIAQWQVAPGYYLYRNKFHFSVTPIIPITVQLPKGEVISKIKGEVLSGNIIIPVTLQTALQTVRLDISYQGCSRDGFCYPPMKQSMTINFDKHTFKTLMTDQYSVQSLLKAENMGWVLFVFVMIGLLLSFTPCILPLIPILAGVIVGHREPVSSKKAFLLSVSYVIGMSLAYALAGLLAALMGRSLQVWLQNPWVISSVSILFVMLAISLFGLFHLRLPRRLQNAVAHWSHQQQSGTYIGAFSMGVLSTLIVSPCVTAPLIGVLLYIADTGDKLLGASALFAMGIGMGLPLLLIGMSAGKWLPKSGAWMEIIKKSFAFVMLGMAIWLLSRIISTTMATLLFGLLLCGFAFFLTAYIPLLMKRSAFIRGFGVLVGLIGVFVMVKTMPIWKETPVERSSAVIVKNINAVNEQIAAANAAHMPVMLDFYADWCESCVTMDKTVFNQPSVKKALAGFVVLRIDLSGNKPEDDALLKHFHVIAPPTVLFFSNQGQEVNAKRIVGEVSASDFISRISTFYAEGCDKKATC
jgi:thiol:disulfide interchange protein DsbD